MLRAKLLAFTASAMIVTCSSALAQGISNGDFQARFTGLVGHIGGTVGGNYLREADGNPDQSVVPFGAFDMSVAIRFPLFTLGFETVARYDHLRAPFDNGDDPAWAGTGAIHALQDIGQARVGGFVQVGLTLPQDQEFDDTYHYWLAGVEGQGFLAHNVLVYGQAGYGNKFPGFGDEEFEGFYKGIVARTGMVYFASERSAITADFEFAASKGYIDSNDPGRHFGFSLTGERQLGESPLFLSFGTSYAHINATDEGDQMDEMTFAVGLDFVFGAGSIRERWTNGLAIGSPRLPVRASAWAEWID